LHSIHADSPLPVFEGIPPPASASSSISGNPWIVTPEEFTVFENTFNNSNPVNGVLDGRNQKFARSVVGEGGHDDEVV
jgi:hypothetical protein